MTSTNDDLWRGWCPPGGVAPPRLGLDPPKRKYGDWEEDYAAPRRRVDYFSCENGQCKQPSVEEFDNGTLPYLLSEIRAMGKSYRNPIRETVRAFEN